MIRYQTDVFPLPSMISTAEKKMIGAMESAGCLVILEANGDQMIVKVREPGFRQIRVGSTSGFPVRGAFANWQERHGATL